MKRWTPPKGQTIVTAYAERASGPGWSNTPLWVITRDGNQTLHEHCIQPNQQPEAVLALYRISEATHLAMVSAIRTE